MFTDYLKQTAEIYELRASRDSLGGVFRAWTNVATSICLVQPSRGGVGRDDEKDGSAATHMILLPGVWDLTAANQVRVDGKTYKVFACRDWNSLGRTHPAGIQNAFRYAYSLLTLLCHPSSLKTSGFKPSKYRSE